MRHALVVWLSLAIVVVVTSTNCSITHRSDGFACTSSAQCEPGRMCTDGLCVVLPGEPIDASMPTVDGKMGSNHPDASDCPMDCTSCDDLSHTCTIDCSQTNCNVAISCPLGWNCTVDCTPDGSCSKGVSCTNAASCTINCTGDNSCRNIACGTGPCDVECNGQSSCRTVGCDNSCRCDVDCGIGSSCEAVTCVSQQCRAPLGGCTSSNAAICDTCPI